CPPRKIDETARVAQVTDGDTLRLVDGRRVRVLGINAPELARPGQAGQAFAEQARDAARQFLPKNAQVHLMYDREQKDRYGRLLAHVYNHKRQSLSAMLLSRGMAFQVVVPPNLHDAECLARQEMRARTNALGIWKESSLRVRPAATL